MEAVEQSNDEVPSLLSFYIHFPYCEQKCFYCGCNSYLRSKEEDDDIYFEAVLSEIDRVIERIDSSRNIAQYTLAEEARALPIQDFWVR